MCLLTAVGLGALYDVNKVRMDCLRVLEFSATFQLPETHFLSWHWCLDLTWRMVHTPHKWAQWPYERR